MINETITHQLNHRSIRKFKDQALTKDEVNLLVDVARHTSTHSFSQACSIISVTDPVKQQKLATIGKQPYIAQAGHLFVFLADQHRNQQIAQEHGADTSVLRSFDRLLIGLSDALIAAQNVMIAAESMGMGAVYLGSILNDVQAVCQLLALPEYVIPVVGMLVGWPDQEPQLKPRMPRDLMHFENSYQLPEHVSEAMKDYDEVVETYYDLRDTSRRVDSFTKQMTRRMGVREARRMEMLADIRAQGFLKE